MLQTPGLVPLFDFPSELDLWEERGEEAACLPSSPLSSFSNGQPFPACFYLPLPGSGTRLRHGQ